MIGSRYLSIAIGGLAVMTAGCNSSAPLKASQARPAMLVVVTERQTGEAWQLLKKGIERAASEERVNVRWEGVKNGVASPHNFQTQANAIERAVKQKVSAVLVQPLNLDALSRSIKSAADAKTPVVLLTSKVDAAFANATVGTDEEAIGARAAELMLKSSRKLKPVVIYHPGSAVQQQRVKGFLNALSTRKLTKPLLIATKDATRIKINLSKRLNGLSGTNALFVVDESFDWSAFDPPPKRWYVVGIGLNQNNLAALKAKKIQRLIAPNYELIGYQGAKTALRASRKESYEPKKAIPVRVLGQ